MRMVPITIRAMNHLNSVKTLPKPAPLAVNGVVRAQDLLGTGSVLVIENAGEGVDVAAIHDGQNKTIDRNVVRLCDATPSLVQLCAFVGCRLSRIKEARQK